MWSRLASRQLTPTARAIQARGVSVIAGPRQVKISTGEKLVHGAIMFTGWFFTPVWVLTHLREYKGKA